MFSLSSAFSKSYFAGAVGGGCLIQCIVWMFQLMWYSIVLSFWLMYAICYGIYRLIVWIVDAIRDRQQQQYCYDNSQDDMSDRQ